MGQTRIQTIANALRVPELQDALLETYRDKKLNRLQAKERLSEDQFVDASKYVDGALRHQLEIAIALGKPQNYGVLANESEMGRAISSEQLAEADFCEAGFKDKTTFVESVRTLGQMLFIHQRATEPLVKEAIVVALSDMYMSFDAEHRDERFARVLAVAIGLQYSGGPESEIHREQVGRFADSLFGASSGALTSAIRGMLCDSKRDETATLLEEARAALGLSLA